MNELYKIIKERRTFRKFKSDPIPKEVIERILEMGIWAPSAMNTQPWEFYVFTGKARDEIVSIMSTAKEGITARLNELFEEKQRNITYNFFENAGGAPVVILVLSKRIPTIQYMEGAIQSCAAAVQNILLAAQFEGLGACWMTGPLWVENEILTYLDRQEDARLIAAIPIGFPDQTTPRGPKRKHKPIQWRED